MKVTSIIAIWALFWVMSAILVLPFGVRTHDEAGIAKIPGQAESAPADFSGLRIVRRASLLSLVLFGLFYLNYIGGWITADDLNFLPAPPNVDGTRG
jgi:predicted secreted protein